MGERCAIVGVGESERSRASGKSTRRMAVEAARAALADAGIEATAIDGVLGSQMMDSCGAHSVAAQLGVRPSFHLDMFAGGGSPESMVAQAIAVIESGICQTVLVFRSMNGRSGRRMGGGDSFEPDLGWLETFWPGSSFACPYGVTTAAQQYGLLATRHMWETGTTEEHLGHVCVASHGHAQRNPRALMHGTALTIDEYLGAPYISTPFRLHDFCLETDEATAIIVTAAARAGEGPAPPIYVEGFAAREALGSATPLALPDITEVATSRAAHRAFEMAGLTAADVDVAALYDCFSWVLLAQLEACGFVGRGEAGPFVAAGNLDVDGELPSNTAGGALAEGYANGMNNLVELVRQLRHAYAGEERQVVDCEIGFSVGWAGAQAAGALVLRGER